MHMRKDTIVLKTNYKDVHSRFDKRDFSVYSFYILTSMSHSCKLEIQYKVVY